jgi:hypothetical protein
MVNLYTASYADIVVDEVKKEDEERFNYREYRKSNELIFTKICNTPYRYGSGSLTTYFTKLDVPLKELFNNRGIIVYGEEADMEKLRKAAGMFDLMTTPSQILQQNHNSKTGQRFTIHKKFNILYVARRNWKYMPLGHNCMHVKEFLEGNKMKVLGKLATAWKIKKECKGDIYTAIRMYPKKFKVFNYANPEIYKATNRIQVFLSEYGEGMTHMNHMHTEMMNDALEACTKLGNMEYSILDDYEAVMKYMVGLDLIVHPYIIGNTEVNQHSKLGALQYIRAYNSIHKDELHKVKMITAEQYHNGKHKDDDGRNFLNATA